MADIKQQKKSFPKEKRGKLYVVSTDIGNAEDVTLRALEVLKLCDLVVCEEIKEGSQLLKRLRIDKRLDTLNEQNESEKVFEYIKMMEMEDKKLALISDCGTPVFADPGYQLVKTAILADLNVIVVPGATSLMTALVRSGMPLDQFLYAGFLSRNTNERSKQLVELSKEPRTVAIYDTPYRLLPLLEDAAQIMPTRKAYIAMNLTMPYETHHYGTFAELFEKFRNERIRAEFVVCFEGNDGVDSPFRRQLNPPKRRDDKDRHYNNKRNSKPQHSRYGSDKPRFSRKGDKPVFKKKRRER
jgi:16S rRNA (cytidine1402-2'-O)-methyltransferase